MLLHRIISVEESQNGGIVAHVLLFGGQVEVRGTIKRTLNTLNLPEVIPDGLPKEWQEKLGYGRLITPREILVFNIKGTWQNYESNGRSRWSQQFMFGLEKRPVDRAVDLSIRHALAQAIIKRWFCDEGSKRPTPGPLVEIEDELVPNSDYFEEIPREFDVTWVWGPRKDGKPNYERILNDASNTKGRYRGYGWIGVADPAVDGKVVLYIRTMICNGDNGWYLRSPGINTNQFRIADLAKEIVAKKNSGELPPETVEVEEVYDFDKGEIKVPLDKLPDYVQKLINPSGKLWNRWSEYVKFRANNPIGFQSDDKQNPDGTMVGAPIYCNSQVKEDVLKKIADDLRKHNFEVQISTAGLTDGEIEAAIG
jgi:hypothetical protein